MLSQIRNLAELSIAIFKNCVSFNPNHMMVLSRLRSFHIDVFCKEECSYLKWDTLWHIAHNHLHIVRNLCVVPSQSPVPINLIDIPLWRVQIIRKGEVLVEHSKKWTCCDYNEFIQKRQFVIISLHALNQINNEGLEQVDERKYVISVKILILQKVFEGTHPEVRLEGNEEKDTGVDETVILTIVLN